MGNKQFSLKFFSFCQSWGVSVLRISLGIIFFWFGMLKILGASPVIDMIKITYSFMPEPAFIIFLGVLEVLIGLGLIFKIYLRTILVIFWLQMLGTLYTFVLAPAILFNDGNIFTLTTLGEFVVKNIVLISAGLVIWGYELSRNSSQNI